MFSGFRIAASAAMRSASAMLEFEYQQNLRRAFIGMFKSGQLTISSNSLLLLDAGSQLTARNDIEVSSGTLEGLEDSLPPWLQSIHEHSKARLRATYQRQTRAQQVELRGSDAKTNVALYPTAMQVHLGHGCESTRAPCSTPALVSDERKEDADTTVRGAIDVLNALIAGLDEEWLNVPGVANLTETLAAPRMDHSYAQHNLDPCTGSESRCEPSAVTAPDATRPFLDLTTPAPSCVDVWQKETFETSNHNRDRLRATLTRTKSLHVPGSCARPSGQLPGSETRTMLHGSDGALNVALYPKAMLVKLSVFEGDDMVDSAVCDPEETVRGAIERLNALVNGIGYDWVSESVASATCMKREGSMDSSSSALSELDPITPLDQMVFPGMVKC